jgi:hypothetical protein
MVPAPPNNKLIVVTTNSARNKTPPELPTSWPTRKKAMITVLRVRGVIIGREDVEELDVRLPTSID